MVALLWQGFVILSMRGLRVIIDLRNKVGHRPGGLDTFFVSERMWCGGLVNWVLARPVRVAVTGVFEWVVQWVFGEVASWRKSREVAKERKERSKFAFYT